MRTYGEGEIFEAIEKEGYRVLGVIGRGTSATAYAARDRAGELVAVKVFQPVSERPILREVREAALELHHENLVQQRFWGAGPKGLYIVMELANAGDLAEWIRDRSTVTSETVACLTTQLLAGLAHLHSLSIVHRDLKPSNILLTVDQSDGVVAKISDFGSAVTLHAPWGTLVPEVPGTAGYIAPEVLAGADADEGSDLFALGLILHAALDLCPDPATDLADLVDSLRAVDPADRPPSARNAARRISGPARWDPRDAPKARQFAHDQQLPSDPPPAGDSQGTSPWSAFPAFLHRVNGALDRRIAGLQSNEEVATTSGQATSTYQPQDDRSAARERLERIRSELGLIPTDPPP